MRQSYHTSTDGNGTTSIVLLVLGMMLLIIVYLVVYGDALKARETPRVYIADEPELSAKVNKQAQRPTLSKN